MAKICAFVRGNKISPNKICHRTGEFSEVGAAAEHGKALEEHSSKRGMEVEANWRRSVCEEKALKLPV